MILWLENPQSSYSNMNVLYGITDEDQSPTMPRSFELEERKSEQLYKEIKRQMKADDKKEIKLQREIKALDEFDQAQVNKFFRHFSAKLLSSG